MEPPSLPYPTAQRQLPPLVHSLDGQDGHWGGGAPKPGASPGSVSLVGGRGLIIWANFCCFPRCITGSWNGSRATMTHTGCWCHSDLTCYSKCWVQDIHIWIFCYQATPICSSSSKSTYKLFDPSCVIGQTISKLLSAPMSIFSYLMPLKNSNFSIFLVHNIPIPLLQSDYKNCISYNS